MLENMSKCSHVVGLGLSRAAVGVLNLESIINTSEQLRAISTATCIERWFDSIAKGASHGVVVDFVKIKSINFEFF